MGFPPNLRRQYLSRFSELIAEGEGIYNDIEVTESSYESWLDEASKVRHHYRVDWQRFVEWRTKVASLLSNIVPENNVNHRQVINFPSLDNRKDRLEYGISLLKGIKQDFETGFLDDLPNQIEGEIAVDYMAQAENLLEEGHRGKFNHVPAAVLAGAVLEKVLRTLATRQRPQVPTTEQKGRPVRLNALIDSHRKTGTYNEAMAKQLRAWADIRNHAAHGEFEQFSRSDVELMIKGINAFLANYLA